MSILSKILGKETREIIKASDSLIDNVSTSDEEKLSLKNGMGALFVDSILKVTGIQAQAIQSEMNGNFLQRSWRPISMLTFLALLVCAFFGWHKNTLNPELELEIVSMIKLGLTGFVALRSIEKVSDKILKNVDLGMLKKKDRKDFME